MGSLTGSSPHFRLGRSRPTAPWSCPIDISYASTFPQEPFWQGLADGRFLLPRCEGCGEWLSPGAWRCRGCGRQGLTWTDASGRGLVYSLMERLPAPHGAGPGTVIAVIRLKEGPSMMGMVPSDKGTVHVGAPVYAQAPATPEAPGLPLFFLAEADGLDVL